MYNRYNGRKYNNRYNVRGVNGGGRDCRLENPRTTDYGPEPFVINIDEATCHNDNFRRALWTGTHLQLTLMSIPSGGEIGLEMHHDTDQFLRIEGGEGVVKMGCQKERLDFCRHISSGDAIFIPAGYFHNLLNTGNCPIKLYSLYAPPNHPRGTLQQTKEIADAKEHY